MNQSEYEKAIQRLKPQRQAEKDERTRADEASKNQAEAARAQVREQEKAARDMATQWLQMEASIQVIRDVAEWTGDLDKWPVPAYASETRLWKAAFAALVRDFWQRANTDLK
jgi:hypothetical protein